MADVLIRDIDPDLKRQVEELAQAHQSSLSDELKALIRKGLTVPDMDIKMGTWLSSLVPPEYRGDDLVFEYHGAMSPPPDFD